MHIDVPLFDPVVFAKTLALISGLAIISCAVAYRVYGELHVRDIIGTSISGLILAYLVHLWVALYKADRRRKQ